MASRKPVSREWSWEAFEGGKVDSHKVPRTHSAETTTDLYLTQQSRKVITID